MNKQYIIFHDDNIDTASITRNLIQFYQNGHIDFKNDIVYELGSQIKFEDFIEMLPKSVK